MLQHNSSGHVHCPALRPERPPQSSSYLAPGRVADTPHESLASGCSRLGGVRGERAHIPATGGIPRPHGTALLRHRGPLPASPRSKGAHAMLPPPPLLNPT